ncbi:MAG: DUF389 domain-containing protein [Planctomycetota bacterium]
MAIVALVDPEASVPLQVRWALWFARARHAALTLRIPPVDGRESKVLLAQVASVFADGEDGEGDQNSKHFRLVCEDGPAKTDKHVEGARQARSGDGEQAGSRPDGDGDADADADGRGERLLCRLVVDDDEEPEEVLQLVGKAVADLLLVFARRIDANNERLAAIGATVLPRVSCSVAVVDLGDERWPPKHLLVAAGGRGAHVRAALRQARELGVAVAGEVTATFVQQDVSRDSHSVGRYRLQRVLRDAFDDERAAASYVVVHNGVESGLVQAIDKLQPDVLVLGMPGPGLLQPRFFGAVPARLCRRTELPVIVCRRALPLGNRLRRWFEQGLQRLIPQADRSSRVELASRVESSSSWNFDFVALTSLSTVIAAFGLLQNSAAVIIGAMLIAPLMTPILGVGLAITQGNAQLARRAAQAILLGVGTAFVLAAIVGYCDDTSGELRVASDEMLARGWPGLLDLFVAFASGLAAAYAHSRPGLIAALPGVAIAAALVPPIATSGLAFSSGDYELAYGALLLFVTNMVAIVLAAAFSLWAVGLRQQRSTWLRHVGNGLVVLVLALTVHLVQRPHIGGIVVLPHSLRPDLQQSLDPAYELIGLRAEQQRGHILVTAEVGGRAAPPPSLASQLRDRILERLGGDAIELRLRYVWQDVAPAQPPATVRQR